MRDVPLIDAHTHRLFSAPEYETLQITAGVCGTDESDWTTILSAETSGKHPVVPFIGIHPWRISPVADSASAKALSDSLATIEQLLDNPSRIRGIGEIGLDKSSTFRATLPLQIEIFRQQLSIAIRKRLPVAIHCVKAWDELLAVLASENPRDTPLIFHSFYGSAPLVRKLSTWNSFFSIRSEGKTASAIKGCAQLRTWHREMVQGELPFPLLHRLLLETDLEATSDLPSTLYRTLLECTYTEAARCLCVPLDELREVVNHNFQRCIGLTA